MRRTRATIPLVLLIFAAAIGCAGPLVRQARSHAAAPPEVQRFTLVHLNDSHGLTRPYKTAGGEVGGYGRVATVLARVRAEVGRERVLFLHAGDVLSRGDALTRGTLGLANVAILNRLGLDLWTPGNGEFYDGVPVLRACIAASKADVLAANVLLKEEGRPMAAPFVVRRVGPVRVAFLGLCFVRTKLPSARPLNVLDPIETARTWVPRLREQADVVVAMTHLGLGKDEALVRAVPGLDLVVGGHSHTRLEAGRLVTDPDGREVLIVQAHEYLKCLGRVDCACVPVGAGGWRLASAEARLIDLAEAVPEAPATAAFVEALWAEHVAAPEPKPKADAAPAGAAP